MVLTEAILPPVGPLAMETFLMVRSGVWGSVPASAGGARDAAECPTMHKKASPVPLARNYAAPDFHNASFEKL